MIDVNCEQLISMTEAAHRLHVAPSTIWRWRQKKGVRGRRLETVKLGGRVMTSLAAIQRFALQSVDDEPCPTIRTPYRRQREIQRAEQWLDAAGI